MMRKSNDPTAWQSKVGEWPKLLSPKALSDRLQSSIATIYRAINEQELPTLNDDAMAIDGPVIIRKQDGIRWGKLFSKPGRRGPKKGWKQQGKKEGK